MSIESGIAISLQELIDLRNTALPQTQINITKKLILSGQKLTHSRSRGIEFDRTREYQPGDDIRSMAWRVTARGLKPHVKVYREEKERPMWMAIDLSPSLYFGTRCCFKSVKSIKQAALTGWFSLLKRERIGAIINTPEKPLIFPPQGSEKYFLTILHSLAEISKSKPIFNEQQHLHQLLLALQQQVRPGSLINLYSDFLQFDTEIEKQLLALSRRVQIILHFVYDPFEAVPPPPYLYQLTNGQQKMLFNMHDAKNREVYRQLFQTKVQQLKDFSLKHQLSLQIHCTDSSKEVI